MSNEVTTVSEVVSDEVTNHPIGGGGLPNNKIYWPDLPSKPLPPIQIYYPAVTYFTSALFISGGMMGFLKAQSKPSLIAGTGVGLSFIAIEQIIPNHPELGHSLAMGISGVVGSVMFRRYRQSGKLFPSAVACAVAYLYSFYQLLNI